MSAATGRRRRGAAGIVALALAGCGYVGDPLPPSLKIPRPVSELVLIQRGENIRIEFRLPELTTDGVVLKRLGGVDVRIGAEGVSPWDRETWEARSFAIPVSPGEPGERLRVETPAANWAGREVVVGVRVAGPTGRWSDWSEWRALAVVRPLPAPVELVAENAPTGVRLSWRWPDERGARFRILRRMAGHGEFTPVGETEAREWTDTAAAYGTAYAYQVQAVLPAGPAMAESPPSAPVEITPEDRFPPPAPGGLTAVATPESVELSWERAGEEPGVTYRVWRAAGGGPFELLAADLPSPVYSDRTVAAGKRYTYAVSAADPAGNESERSPAVEVSLPEP